MESFAPLKELNWRGFCRSCDKNCFNTCGQSKEQQNNLTTFKKTIDDFSNRLIKIEKLLEKLTETLNHARKELDKAVLR